MKIGDLVKVLGSRCLPHSNVFAASCDCFFCSSGSNRIGVVLAPTEFNKWYVMFDVGEWELFEKEMELIND